MLPETATMLPPPATVFGDFVASVDRP